MVIKWLFSFYMFFYVVFYLFDRCLVDSELFFINVIFFEIIVNRLYYLRFFLFGYLESVRFFGSIDVYF